MSDIEDLIFEIEDLISDKNISKIDTFLEKIDTLDLSPVDIQYLKDESLLTTIVNAICDEDSDIHFEIIKKLIGKGANINYLEKDEDEERNALLIVLQSIDDDNKDKILNLLEFLLINGADINIQDSNGNTPLHIMCRKDLRQQRGPGAHKYCDLVLSLNAVPNIKNINGNTPLHEAVIDKNVNAVTCLLKSSIINTNIKNKNGDTPMEILLKSISYDSVLKYEHIQSAASAAPARSIAHIFGDLLFNSNPPITYDELEGIKELLDFYEDKVRSLKLLSIDENKWIDIYNKIRQLIISKMLRTEQKLAVSKSLSPRLGEHTPLNYLDVQSEYIFKHVTDIPSVAKKFELEEYPESRMEISEEPEVESNTPFTSDNPDIVTSEKPCVAGNCNIMGGKKKIKKTTKKKRKSNKRKSNKKKSNKKSKKSKKLNK